MERITSRAAAHIQHAPLRQSNGLLFARRPLAVSGKIAFGPERCVHETIVPFDDLKYDSAARFVSGDQFSPICVAVFFHGGRIAEGTIRESCRRAYAFRGARGLIVAAGRNELSTRVNNSR